MSDAVERNIADMQERFGEEEAEGYMRLMRATRSLVWMYGVYAEANEGSFVEHATRDTLDKMMGDLDLDHAKGIVESLAALAHHLRAGGSYNEWFESIGIEPDPPAGKTWENMGKPE